MNVAVIEKKQYVYENKKNGVNLKQDMFCKMFATDPKIIGNASQCYLKVYGGSYDNAKVCAMRLLDKPEITARINEYLSNEGFNEVNVDKQHLFIINQKKDLNVAMKGIQEFNKLKKRVSNTIELVIPKPIMNWDDDEVIHKIDKSKAKDVSQDSNNVV